MAQERSPPTNTLLPWNFSPVLLAGAAVKLARGRRREEEQMRVRRNVEGKEAEGTVTKRWAREQMSTR